MGSGQGKTRRAMSGETKTRESIAEYVELPRSLRQLGDVLVMRSPGDEPEEQRIGLFLDIYEQLPTDGESRSLQLITARKHNDKWRMDICVPSSSEDMDLAVLALREALAVVERLQKEGYGVHHRWDYALVDTRSAMRLVENMRKARDRALTSPSVSRVDF